MVNIKISSLKDKNIDAIIFDLGGVILNLDVSRSHDAFLKLGFSNIGEEMGRILNRISESDEPGLFHLYEKGKITSRQFREGLRKASGKDWSDRDIDLAWTAMLLDLPLENLRIIEKLKDSYRLFLLSNTNEIHIDSLHALPQSESGFTTLISLFEKVYYSHDVGMRKPDVEIFHHVIEDSGLNPQTTLFVDDSSINVEGARKAGLQVYHHKANSGLDSLFDIS